MGESDPDALDKRIDASAEARVPELYHSTGKASRFIKCSGAD